MVNRCRTAFFAIVTNTVITILLGNACLFAQDIPEEGSRKTELTGTLSRTTTVKEVTLTIKCHKKMVSGGENYVTITLRNDGEKAVDFCSGPQKLDRLIRCNSQYGVYRSGGPADEQEASKFWCVV